MACGQANQSRAVDRDALNEVAGEMLRRRREGRALTSPGKGSGGTQSHGTCACGLGSGLRSPQCQLPGGTQSLLAAMTKREELALPSAPVSGPAAGGWKPKPGPAGCRPTPASCEASAGGRHPASGSHVFQRRTRASTARGRSKRRMDEVLSTPPKRGREPCLQSLSFIGRR